MWKIPVVKIEGPDYLFEKCLVDPDLQLTFPDLKIAETSDAPFTLIFIHKSSCQMYWKNNTLYYQGNLKTIKCREFRRLIMYIARVAVTYKGYILVHGACVESKNGKGFLLCGSQGSGKTSLSLKLAQQGFKIKSTDICLIDPSMRVVAGTKHINLYPGITNCIFTENKAQDPNEDNQYKTKISFSLEELSEKKIISYSKKSVQIKYICKIKVIEGEQHQGFTALNFQESLADSVYLMEDWTLSSWISPEHQVFYPIRKDDKKEKLDQKMAISLAKIPHYQIRGNLSYHIALINNLNIEEKS